MTEMTIEELESRYSDEAVVATPGRCPCCGLPESDGDCALCSAETAYLVPLHVCRRETAYFVPFRYR